VVGYKKLQTTPWILLQFCKISTLKVVQFTTGVSKMRLPTNRLRHYSLENARFAAHPFRRWLVDSNQDGQIQNLAKIQYDADSSSLFLCQSIWFCQFLKF
jgi:hypothetical protein